MELHAFDGEFLVAEAHDGAGSVFVCGPGADFKFFRQIVLLDDKRVIASGRHGRGQAAEDGFAIVTDCAGFAVHQARGAHHLSAKGSTDGLVSEADAENRNLAREVANEIDADSGLLRRAWTGRNDNAVRLHYLNVGDCNLIVPANLNLGAEFPEILNEVVGKRIVIVENEDQWNTQLLDYHRVEDRVASEAN